jgi:DNA-binding beta-propeller fold protein YncE
VAVDAVGFVSVADLDNHRIQLFTRNGGFVGRWGREGGGNGEFVGPGGVAVDGEGRVYVADVGNYRIQKFLLA